MRLLKILAFLIVVAGLSLVGFAYFGNLSPDQVQVSQPVDIDEK